MKNNEEIKKDNINTKNKIKEEKNIKKEKEKQKEIEIEKIKAEYQELNDKFLRVTAEMQNMRRRYEEEIAKIYRYEGESLIKKILTILDNFERAISMKSEDDQDKIAKFLEGFVLIYNDLKKNLEDIGVKEIECLNKPFDPESMEAVLTEHIEGVEKGYVTCILQKGYTYNEKVIRTAMVKVNE